MRNLLLGIVAVFRGLARDILRGMRIKHALQSRRISKCTDFMTDLYTRPPRER